MYAMEQKEEIKWLVVCVYRCEYGEDEIFF